MGQTFYISVVQGSAAAVRTPILATAVCRCLAVGLTGMLANSPGYCHGGGPPLVW